ncbi:MAG: 50S ribosomal protein L23 [Candidatus Omnitrophota bacterium]
MNTADIIRFPLVTEKGSSFLQPHNKYQFSVLPSANKPEIKKAVEKIYKVKVIAVHISNFTGKKRNYRRQAGKKADWKKAVVTLKKGERIEFV